LKSVGLFLYEGRLNYRRKLSGKIAEIVDNKKVHKITVNADGTYSYPVFQNRVFDKAKHYLFPIPQSEIDKNRNLVQNPGWN
jgi:hypothetical protein